MFHSSFVQTLTSSAESYVSADAASVSSVIKVGDPSLTIFGQLIIGNGANGTAANPNGGNGGLLFGNGGQGVFGANG